MILSTSCFVSTGQSYNLSTKVNEAYLTIRNGYIIPYQNTTAITFKTSVDL